jgi:hypothetical protein
LNSGASLDDYRWLVGAEGRRWLAEAAESLDSLARQADRLRKHLSAARCRLVLEQIALQRRARQKFSAPERMFFTPTGLEQATDEWVAAYKASRFPPDVELADLCCGVGGDLLALAARGPTLGVDRDPIVALLAEANRAAWHDRGGQAGESPRSASEVLLGDIAEAPLERCAAWHIDPDRRPQGRRTTRVELHEPGAPAIERLLHRNSSAAIKLAPAAELPAAWSSAAELEWISRGGQCRQLVAWFGDLASAPGMSRATILKQHPSGGRQPSGDVEAARSAERGTGIAEQLPADERRSPATSDVRTLVGRSSREIPVAARLGRYLAEPDAAVLAADLTGVLAEERELGAIAPGSVYLTGDRLATDLALAWFEIADALPFDIKRLKALVRERRIGRLEIKKRGVPHDPEIVRRQLRVPGDNAATLFITRLGDAVVAILSSRC